MKTTPSSQRKKSYTDSALIHRRGTDDHQSYRLIDERISGKQTDTSERNRKEYETNKFRVETAVRNKNQKILAQSPQQSLEMGGGE